jgi:hypothetical protein
LRALVVLMDGVALPEEQARAFWQRFSAHMEAHRGDLQGFAAAEGLMSVRPVIGADGPELHASRTLPQTPYANAPRSTGEASAIHGTGVRKKRKPGKSR